ncbi:MAG: hypothetical protein GY717_06675 [Rhodobacteraceae bacterium]|nr:hypothetical protein [Paracoccaceae bacterium]
MAEQTSIEWTDATWNPITDCRLVSQAGTPRRVGKGGAGRLLNGREWNGVPNGCL